MMIYFKIFSPKSNLIIYCFQYNYKLPTNEYTIFIRNFPNYKFII